MFLVFWPEDGKKKVLAEKRQVHLIDEVIVDFQHFQCVMIDVELVAGLFESRSVFGRRVGRSEGHVILLEKTEYLLYLVYLSSEMYLMVYHVWVRRVA